MAKTFEDRAVNLGAALVHHVGARQHDAWAHSNANKAAEHAAQGHYVRAALRTVLAAVNATSAEAARVERNRLAREGLT